MEPAAKLAQDGVPVGRHYRRAAVAVEGCLGDDPAAKRTFLAVSKGLSAAPEPGWRLVQKDLAATLRRLGRDPEAFYRGPLADRIAAAVRARGGILTAADLAGYRTREREVLWGTYRGHRIAAFPPPSAGGAIVLGLLQALEAEAPGAAGRAQERFLHAFVESAKRLFARRAGALGDPDFVPGASAAASEMASKAFAAQIRAGIGERAAPSDAVGPAAPAGHTSHVSAVDAEGNAVALTTTVNLQFGSGVVVPGTGILLNDEMDDFDAAPGVPNAFGLVGGEVNLPCPESARSPPCRPRSSSGRTASCCWRSGRRGAPPFPPRWRGSSSTWSTTACPRPGAGHAPIHHQWIPDVIASEPGPSRTRRAMRSRPGGIGWRN